MPEAALPSAATTDQQQRANKLKAFTMQCRRQLARIFRPNRGSNVANTSSDRQRRPGGLSGNLRAPYALSGQVALPTATLRRDISREMAVIDLSAHIPRTSLRTKTADDLGILLEGRVDVSSPATIQLWAGHGGTLVKEMAVETSSEWQAPLAVAEAVYVLKCKPSLPSTCCYEELTELKVEADRSVRVLGQHILVSRTAG